jgi:hypothetical protein
MDDVSGARRHGLDHEPRRVEPSSVQARGDDSGICVVRLRGPDGEDEVTGLAAWMTAISLALSVAAPPAAYQEHAAHKHPAEDGAGQMPLLRGFGDWRHRVTTVSPEAQRYFDQGSA